MFPRRDARPGLASIDALERKRRAQGTPDAGRTREPCVQRECTLRTQATTGQPQQSGVPCAMVYGLYVVSPECRAL